MLKLLCFEQLFWQLSANIFGHQKGASGKLQTRMRSLCSRTYLCQTSSIRHMAFVSTFKKYFAKVQLNCADIPMCRNIHLLSLFYLTFI